MGNWAIDTGRVITIPIAIAIVGAIAILELVAKVILIAIVIAILVVVTSLVNEAASQIVIVMAYKRVY